MQAIKLLTARDLSLEEARDAADGVRDIFGAAADDTLDLSPGLTTLLQELVLALETEIAREEL